MNQFDFVRRRAFGAVIGVVAAAALLPAASTLAAPTDFPAGYEAYHTYSEVVTDLDAEVARHPSIVRKFSIGKSYQGRPLWAAEINGNVNVEQDEPEILFDSLIHAREHITVEMDLYILHLLVDNYGKDSRITHLVNTREIFIIFEVNPDGGEYDISGGHFHHWRKNRQPTPGSTYIGTDLNRNFGFKWGCCGGSSGNPSSNEYRGPFAWSSPEDTAYRNFIRSRVIGGKQRIRIAVSWHSYGKVILWPYGYTLTDVPSTMTLDDHKTFVALGKAAGALNGYTPKQASDLYISDGTAHDWDYHEQGVFHFTFEMGPGYSGGTFYPPESEIGALTSANRGAVLYLIRMADCPYRAAGLQTTYC